VHVDRTERVRLHIALTAAQKRECKNKPHKNTNDTQYIKTSGKFSDSVQTNQSM